MPGTWCASAWATTRDHPRRTLDDVLVGEGQDDEPEELQLGVALRVPLTLATSGVRGVTGHLDDQRGAEAGSVKSVRATNRPPSRCTVWSLGPREPGAPAHQREEPALEVAVAASAVERTVERPHPAAASTAAGSAAAAAGRPPRSSPAAARCRWRPRARAARDTPARSTIVRAALVAGNPSATTRSTGRQPRQPSAPRRRWRGGAGRRGTTNSTDPREAVEREQRRGSPAGHQGVVAEVEEADRQALMPRDRGPRRRRHDEPTASNTPAASRRVMAGRASPPTRRPATG